jgi:DNA-binding LytR/AlgR family response regulator
MKILIIEDEQQAAERLIKLLTEVAPNKAILGVCKSVQQTINWLNENEYPNLILADVELSDGLSFDIFQQLDKKIPVIFISAYDTYALNAFKVQGLHYLLKPVKKHELKEAIERYDTTVRKVNVENNNEENIPAVINTRQFQERIIIYVGSQIKLLHDYEIAYLYAESKMVFIVTFDKVKYTTDITLEAFEKMLNPKLFYRINRQFIVNLKAISKMMPASKQRIELVLEPSFNQETITSFERTPQFKKWLLGEV